MTFFFFSLFFTIMEHSFFPIFWWFDVCLFFGSGGVLVREKLNEYFGCCCWYFILFLMFRFFSFEFPGFIFFSFPLLCIYIVPHQIGAMIIIIMDRCHICDQQSVIHSSSQAIAWQCTLWQYNLNIIYGFHYCRYHHHHHHCDDHLDGIFEIFIFSPILTFFSLSLVFLIWLLRKKWLNRSNVCWWEKKSKKWRRWWYDELEFFFHSTPLYNLYIRFFGSNNLFLLILFIMNTEFSSLKDFFFSFSSALFRGLRRRMAFVWVCEPINVFIFSFSYLVFGRLFVWLVGVIFNKKNGCFTYISIAYHLIYKKIHFACHINENEFLYIFDMNDITQINKYLTLLYFFCAERINENLSVFLFFRVSTGKEFNSNTMNWLIWFIFNIIRYWLKINKFQYHYLTIIVYDSRYGCLWWMNHDFFSLSISITIKLIFLIQEKYNEIP